MRGRAVRVWVVGACIWFFCLKAGAEGIPQIVARAKQAIIQINALDAQGNVLGTGTAFFIRSDGTAVTNAHVVKGATRLIGLTNTGAEYRFERVVNLSPDVDLAILKFSAVDVPYLTLGSSRAAMEGQRVLVIGNPQGLQGTVSDGLISAFRADHALIQITAPISPGSSGSPVLNEEGQVIGVAFLQLVNGQNLNFAIASEEVEKAERLVSADNSAGNLTEVARGRQAPSPTPDARPQPDLPIDTEQQIARLKKAAEAGDTDAMNALGIHYQSNSLYGHAFFWFQKAAQSGDAEGMVNLGCMYDYGLGMSPDYDQALYWFRKATQTGNGQAMTCLGLMYQYGNGVPRDYVEARRWYEKAAALGDWNGMDALSTVYAKGLGVARDDAKARAWQQKFEAALRVWRQKQAGKAAK